MIQEVWDPSPLTLLSTGDGGEGGESTFSHIIGLITHEPTSWPVAEINIVS